MKSNKQLDEMQESKLLKIQERGFWLVFWILFAAIFVQALIASIDKGTRGSAGRKCPHTASKPLRIHKVFSAAFSLSASISAPAELLRIGQPWIFEGFLFFWTQAHLSPAKDKRAKSTEKTYLSDVWALVNRRLA